MSKKKISELRREYNLKKLTETEISSDPIEQFSTWMLEVISSDCLEPNAMTLSTSTFDGKPSARIVLLKDYDKAGFTFFTNYESKKGVQLLQNPYAALTFFWPELERQVRVEGKVSKVNAQTSDRYFYSRPEKSKIGAWASPQSKVLPNRKYLDNLKSDFQEEFSGKTISRPENWGGYILEPNLIEFWQGRPSRFHDRIQYTFHNNEWVIERLAP